MMTYDDFYTIAEYGNENWKGSFTPREIANNAYDYLCEYQASKIKGKPTRTMTELCKLICEDMDYADYYVTFIYSPFISAPTLKAEIQEESENALTVEQMKQILSDFIMEI